jgi:hypothetical protein
MTRGQAPRRGVNGRTRAVERQRAGAGLFHDRVTSSGQEAAERACTAPRALLIPEERLMLVGCRPGGKRNPIRMLVVHELSVANGT